MEVKINKVSSNQLELEIEIPASQTESYFELAASELSKDMKVNGFRPGKVPVEIVEREKGSQNLYNQAANLAIQRTLGKAALENKIEMIGQPDIVITQIVRGNPMKYKAKVWVIPEIKLANYQGLEVKKQEIKVEDKELDKSLEYLRKSRMKLVTINRPAKIGDRVEIDFTTQIGGVMMEGGESKNHPVILGDNRFIPGFEKELEGMKAGEEKEFSLKVPADWPRENLVNKDLDFRVKINLVQERDIPEPSDEFAKSLGNFESLDKLKQNIKEGLFTEKELREKERIRMELIEKVAKDSQIDIPEILIENELEKMIGELEHNVLSMGLEFDRYLREIKKTTEDLKKEWRNQAEKRVKIGLVLREIIKKEKIEANEEEITDKANETLKQYPGIEEAGKNIDPVRLREYAENVIKNEKAFQLLEREAKII